MANYKQIIRYGSAWPGQATDLEIEFAAIRLGGRWKDKVGRNCGAGLFTHFKAAQTLCWPEDDHHRWSDLALQSIVDNDIAVFIGPGDSGKTDDMAKWALIDWWSSPSNGLFIISSTDVRGFELRIWGRLKGLFNRARERYPDLLPGNVLESMHAITPDAIDRGGTKARLIDRGMICIPCLQGERYIGMGKYVGIKPPGPNGRLRYIGDELQFMGSGHLQAFDNWYGKRDFKSVMSGNPLDPMDPLGKAAEPIGGWNSYTPPTKTATWRSTFFNALVLNFVGTDSPNFDYPRDQPVKYDYLVGWKKLDMVAATYGKDSVSWSSQCEGVMRPGLTGKRVITLELCRLHNAHGKAEWNGTARTRLYSCDPAYGGGDRCVGGMVEFGESVEGSPILCVHRPELIPVSLKLAALPKEEGGMLVEDQIAKHVKDTTEALNIPPTNIFYDSFGKGTMGFAFAKLFGYVTPVPVDSGAKPTRRPVRQDLYIDDNGERRLKRCDEHYSKFVTEMWYSVREIIEGDQMRELPDDVRKEGCMREYKTVLGNKIEVEKKEDTKQRMGCSPDLFDWLAVAVEGARRLGFKIMRLGIALDSGESASNEQDDSDDFEAILKSRLLVH